MLLCSAKLADFLHTKLRVKNRKIKGERVPINRNFIQLRSQAPAVYNTASFLLYTLLSPI